MPLPTPPPIDRGVSFCNGQAPPVTTVTRVPFPALRSRKAQNALGRSGCLLLFAEVAHRTLHHPSNKQPAIGNRETFGTASPVTVTVTVPACTSELWSAGQSRNRTRSAHQSFRAVAARSLTSKCRSVSVHAFQSRPEALP